MTTGSSPTDLTQPHDTCVRCGKPTPLGVALCEDDNPAALSGPSATQVHGTIVVGIGIGFLILALVANWALGSVGPFTVRVLAAAGSADGGADIVFAVTNAGAGANRATCRITRGGVEHARRPGLPDRDHRGGWHHRDRAHGAGAGTRRPALGGGATPRPLQLIEWRR